MWKKTFNDMNDMVHVSNMGHVSGIRHIGKE